MIKLKRIVVLKDLESNLQNELKKVQEEIRFIMSLKGEQLKFYESITTDREKVGKSEFVKEIIDFLKSQNKSVSWLARGLGKNYGTVRSWLYSTTPITEENRKKIKQLLYEKEGEQKDD